MKKLISLKGLYELSTILTLVFVYCLLKWGHPIAAVIQGLMGTVYFYYLHNS